MSGIFEGDSIYNNGGNGGGGGGGPVSVDNVTIFGDGTPENPLNADIPKISDLITSDNLFTMNLGAVTEDNLIYGNGLYAIGALLMPDRSFELDANTSIFVPITQVGGNLTDCNELYFCLYEYDMTTDTINWIANTDNLNLYAISENAGGLGKIGILKSKLTYVKNNKYTMSNNKLYYYVILTDGSQEAKFIGNTFQTTTPLNDKPYMVFYADNLSPRPTSAANVQNDFAQIIPQGPRQNRFFAAFSNVV